MSFIGRTIDGIMESEWDKMNDVIKGMILMMMLIYLLSPIDACPGIIADDLIVMLIGMSVRNKISSNN